MVSLINGLGGTVGFGENELYRNDDGYSTAIDITSVFQNGLNFFGTRYDNMYVNTNGSVTFNFGLSTYTPTTITSATYAGLFPFWADVDTRSGTSSITPGGTSKGTNLVYWDIAPGRDRIVITWDDVGYYSYQTDKLNAFQIVITDLSDRTGYRDGDFMFEYRYETLNWTTGSASGGVNGLGGNIARAGWSAANGLNFFEMPGSGNQTGALTWDTRAGNTGTDGLWRFVVRNSSAGDDRITGGASDDVIDGGAGNDSLNGGLGGDYLAGGLGNDLLIGGAQNDYLVGGPGRDSLYGKRGNDVLNGGLGNDLLNGGLGKDWAEFTDAAARVNLALTGRQNTGNGYDRLVSIENLLGSSFDDVLRGNGRANVIDGRAGNDKIFGKGGNDRLIGGDGADTVYGGSGSDKFIFAELNDISTGEKIGDFQHGIDKINLRPIAEDLDFIGRAAFTGDAGEVRFNRAQTQLEIDSTGDGVADYIIDLPRVTLFTAIDILV
ncbi:hypothetical protein E7811_09990 [Aliigemmobacter aestuarii]|uniref:NIDO domain-containing protein n=1 Tax=Aliigemmobacter aestuarii TaxID=1445661 RepID=A0A4S3MMF2_9RHOB|nr:nidogen-like domain-containing protein [Gemmobacter aestuarii]THD83600.1 hypothetical protein E7811_09990 [Gemmobacter aestuarii]